VAVGGALASAWRTVTGNLDKLDQYLATDFRPEDLDLEAILCEGAARLRYRSAHARSGRPAAAPGRGPLATAPSAIASVFASPQAPLSRLLQDRHVVAKTNVLLRRRGSLRR
jgi:hypothetical protein